MIHVNEPMLDGLEERYLLECIRSGWISSEGPLVARFEERFAERVDRRYGIAVCNGSAALEVAVAALGLGPGDEIILPTFTIISCAAAIVRAGATPVVVDCDAQTWNMTVDAIEARLSSRTRAIMVVHIYGLPVDMAPVLDLANRHGLAIIEDAAQMHGQTCGGRKCGSFGELSTFSFYANKHVTTGEGGMVVTDDPVLADRCRSLRNHCFSPSRRFVHEDLGWNFRMTSLQAAVGLAQIERLNEVVARKRLMGQRYDDLLAGLAGLRLPIKRTSYADNIYWVYGVVLDDAVPFDAAHADKRLHTLGVSTRPFFWPMHEQPVFRRMGLFQSESCPVASLLARRGFYLPSGLTLDEAQQEVVASALRKVMT